MNKSEQGKKRSLKNTASLTTAICEVSKGYNVSNCPETGQAIRNVPIIDIIQFNMVTTLALGFNVHSAFGIHM